MRSPFSPLWEKVRACPESSSGMRGKSHPYPVPLPSKERGFGERLLTHALRLRKGYPHRIHRPAWRENPSCISKENSLQTL